MGRDTHKNDYYSVRLAKESLVNRALLQDAADSGLSVPDIIVMRLTDLYKGVQVSQSVSLQPKVVTAAVHPDEEKPHQSEGTDVGRDEIEPEGQDEDLARANASAFFDDF